MWTYIKKEDYPKFINQYSQFDDFSNGLILLETADAYFLPRLFSQNYPSQYLSFFDGGKQESFQPAVIENIEFKGTLRPEQVEILNELADIYSKNQYINGIIKARPGIGKSIMAVYLASQLKIKTMIVVDNQNLMKQWIQSFLDFTNLTVDDIGIVKQKVLGIDKPIIIAMAQTLMRKAKTKIQENFKLLDKARIGLVVYDEVHATSSAPVFSKVSLLFRTKNVIGLSATPFQTGLAEVLMLNTVGDVISNSKNYDMKPIYNLIHYNSKLDNKKIYVMNKLTDYLRKKSFYNKVIIDSEIYQNLIVEQTSEKLKLGHRIIIICFTKAQVKTLSELLTQKGIENTRFFGEEREITYKEKVLVVTYSFAGKGFDYKELSCLILACPLAGKKSLIQVIGRILRTEVEKLSPVVIDLADLAVPGFTIPEIRMKKKVVSDEFDCEIVDTYL